MPIQECTLPDGGGKGWRWGESGKCFADRADAEKQAQAAYANGYAGDADMPQDHLALDRAASARSTDEDGHLHVTRCNISKANVCGYLGREVPGAAALGWQPDKVYQLLRHPDALAQAADSFANKPLLNLHKPQTAQDHDHDLTVGTIGNVQWNDPYLTADLTVWDGDSIRDIESGAQKELSAAYRYEVDPTPGVYKGARYDGIMTKIRGNHVALVRSGRAGSDVVVGDSALPPPPPPPNLKELFMATNAKSLSRPALFATGAVVTYLQPKLAQDAKLDVTPIFQGVTKANFKQRKAGIAEKLKAAANGKLAQDASLDDVIELLDKLDEVLPEEGEPPVAVGPELRETGADPAEDAEVTVEEALAALKGKISDEELEALKAKLSGAREAPAAAQDTLTRAAMDAAIAATAAAVEQRTIERLNGIKVAEEEVRPFVGKLSVAMDSAEAIYEFALKSGGVKLDGVPPAAYRAMVGMLQKPGAQAPIVSPARVAMDSSANERRAKMFPNAGRMSAA